MAALHVLVRALTDKCLTRTWWSEGCARPLIVVMKNESPNKMACPVVENLD